MLVFCVVVHGFSSFWEVGKLWKTMFLNVFKGLGSTWWVPRGPGDHSDHYTSWYDGIWLHFWCVFDDRSLDVRFLLRTWIVQSCYQMEASCPIGMTLVGSIGAPTKASVRAHCWIFWAGWISPNPFGEQQLILIRRLPFYRKYQNVAGVSATFWSLR